MSEEASSRINLVRSPDRGQSSSGDSQEVTGSPLISSGIAPENFLLQFLGEWGKGLWSSSEERGDVCAES